MERLRISVLLATCNGERYLREQLQSIATQTRLPDELILGDDLSSDSTLDIAEEFSTNAPFPVVVSQNFMRLGYKQNFSNLATRASGDILVFCDQDDIWNPQKLAALEQAFQSAFLCVIHDIGIINAAGKPLQASFLKLMHASATPATRFVKGCATAIRRQLANAVFPLPSRSEWSHDKIVHAVAETTGTRLVLEDVLIQHRIHEDNLSGYLPADPKNRRRLNSMLDAFEEAGARHLPSPSIFPVSCSGQDFRIFLRAVRKLVIDPAEARRLAQSAKVVFDLVRIRAAARQPNPRQAIRMIIRFSSHQDRLAWRLKVSILSLIRLSVSMVKLSTVLSLGQGARGK